VEELQAAVVVMPEQPQSFLESLFQTPVAQQVAARCRRPTVLIR
jgi:nucleotide-binding universal stress UspA family protein